MATPFKVVHLLVHVRSAPSIAAAKLGSIERGRFVWVRRVCADGWAELEEPAGGFCLVDGASLGLCGAASALQSS